MALNGSISGSITKDAHYSIRIDWSAMPDINTNTSSVTFKAYVINDWSIAIGKNDFAISIIEGYSGENKSIIFKAPALTTIGEHCVGEFYRTIYHNSEGHGFFNISATYNISFWLNGEWYENINAAPQEFWLDQIPRLANISIDKNNVLLGDTINITIDNKAPNTLRTHIYYAFYNAVDTIRNLAFIVPKDFAFQIPNSNSGWGRIVCETFLKLDDTFLGATECEFTVRVPDTPEFNPSFQFTITRETQGTSVPSEWNMYVQNKSQCITDFPTSGGAYGSTISQYKVTSNVGHLTYLRQCWHDLKVSGIIAFTGTITDSRGRTYSETKSINVVPYSTPNINSVLSQRCLKTGDLSDEGTYAKCHCWYTVSPCDEKNRITTNIAYRKLGENVWKTPIPPTFQNNTDKIIGTGDIETDYTYEVKYQIEDLISPPVYRIDKISTAQVILDFKIGGKGIAVGKVSEVDNTFEISPLWNLKLNNGILRNFVVLEGFTNTTGNSDYYGAKWGTQQWKSGKIELLSVISVDLKGWGLSNVYYKTIYIKLPEYQGFPFTSSNTIVTVGGDNQFVNWYSGGYYNDAKRPNCISVTVFSANANGTDRDGGIPGIPYTLRLCVKRISDMELL